MLAGVLMTAWLLALAACEKQTSSTPAAPTPSATADNGSLSEPTTAADQAQLAATLQELTQAARRYGVEQRRAPRSMEELVSKGYVTSIPQPPPGKKFAIDKEKLQVFLTSP